MSPTIILSLTFGAVTSAVLGIYSIFADLRGGTQARVRRRIDESTRETIRERVKKSPLFKDLSQLAAATAGQQARALSRRERFDLLVEGSGLGVTSNAVIGIAAVIGVAAAILAYVLLPLLLVPPMAFAVGAALPVFFIKKKRDARLEKLLSQLPDAFDLMARVIRAGQTMSQAFRSVSDEFPAPISSEFAVCFEQQNLGIPPETALRDLAQRTGLLELKILVVAIVVQEQTGGNLADMLDKLSGVIRERYRMRGVIKTLTAEGRMQAALLLGLPPALFLMMLFMNRPYALELFDHPILIVITLISEAIGGLWIRSIVNFEI
jgi:tight adherence protein B